MPKRRAKYSPEVITKAIAMRATGKSQAEVAALMGLDSRTIRRFETLQTTPVSEGEGDPAKLREEWFKILSGRLRLAAATENDAAISELIKAGAALLNTPEPTGDHTTAEIPARQTREEIKAIKPTVVHIPTKKWQEPDDEKGAS